MSNFQIFDFFLVPSFCQTFRHFYLVTISICLWSIRSQEWVLLRLWKKTFPFLPITNELSIVARHSNTNGTSRGIILHTSSKNIWFFFQSEEVVETTHSKISLVMWSRVNNMHGESLLECVMCGRFEYQDYLATNQFYNSQARSLEYSY